MRGALLWGHVLEDSSLSNLSSVFLEVFRFGVGVVPKCEGGTLRGKPLRVRDGLKDLELPRVVEVR